MSTVVEEETQKRSQDPAPQPAPAPAPKIDIHAERNTGAKAERERINSIRKLADEFEVEELGKRAIDEGWELPKFREETLNEVGKRNNEYRSTPRPDGSYPDDNLGLGERELSDFSFHRLMRYLADPSDSSAKKQAEFEMDVSRAATDKLGSEFKARGIYIPSEVVYAGEKRDLSVGTPTAGGNLVATNLLAGSFIDLLRNAQITAQAGVRTMSGLVGNVDIPRQSGGSTMQWLAAEDAEAQESEPTFDQVPLTPKDAAVFTEATRRLLQQSTPAVDGLIRADLAQAIGIGTDRAVLYGSGAAGQPTGVTNQTGINVVTFAAADPTYQEVVSMVKEAKIDNALMGSLAWMIDPEGWEAFMTTEKAANTAKFIMADDGSVIAYPVYDSNQITAEDYIFGNWSDVIIGEWGGFEMNIDPYTHSLRGRVRYIVFKTMDVAVRHPESFVIGNDGV